MLKNDGDEDETAVVVDISAATQSQTQSAHASIPTQQSKLSDSLEPSGGSISGTTLDPNKFEYLMMTLLDMLPSGTDDLHQQQYSSAFSSALRSLPTSYTEELMEALDTVPEIVHKESHPNRFIARYHRHQHAFQDAAATTASAHTQEASSAASEAMIVMVASAAAKQLAWYWKTRKAMFRKFAFVPLTQTGEGALKRNDLHALHSGFAVVLTCRPVPTTAADPAMTCMSHPSTTTTICIDCSKCRNTELEIRKRCLFYLYSIVQANDDEDNVRDTDREEGINLMCVIDKHTSIDRIMTTIAFQDLLEVVPCHLNTLYIVCVEPSPGHFRTRSTEFQQNVKHDLYQSVVILVEVSHEAMARTLEEHGYTRECLPECLRGDWNHTKHLRWCEERARIEWGLPAPKGRGKGVRTTSESTIADEVDIANRKRKMNVLHSRRKRERRRLQTSELQGTFNQLQSQNLELYQKNKALEHLLEQAKLMLSHHPPMDRMQQPQQSSAGGNVSATHNVGSSFIMSSLNPLQGLLVPSHTHTTWMPTHHNVQSGGNSVRICAGSGRSDEMQRRTDESTHPNAQHLNTNSFENVYQGTSLSQAQLLEVLLSTQRLLSRSQSGQEQQDRTDANISPSRAASNTNLAMEGSGGTVDASSALYPPHNEGPSDAAMMVRGIPPAGMTTTGGGTLSQQSSQDASHNALLEVFTALAHIMTPQQLMEYGMPHIPPPSATVPALSAASNESTVAAATLLPLLLQSLLPPTTTTTHPPHIQQQLQQQQEPPSQQQQQQPPPQQPYQLPTDVWQALVSSPLPLSSSATTPAAHATSHTGIVNPPPPPAAPFATSTPVARSATHDASSNTTTMHEQLAVQLQHSLPALLWALSGGLVPSPNPTTSRELHADGTDDGSSLSS
jgi:hypothetical protein